MSPSDETAVAALRRTTNAAHRRLERRSDLMAPDLTPARYRALLVGFASVHQTLDREIGAQLSVEGHADIATLDLDSRRRLPALSSDLERLGVTLPAAVPLRLTSLAGALGALYVSEGATLGGAVIAPHVVAVLGADTPVAVIDRFTEVLAA